MKYILYRLSLNKTIILLLIINISFAFIYSVRYISKTLSVDARWLDYAIDEYETDEDINKQIEWLLSILNDDEVEKEQSDKIRINNSIEILNYLKDNGYSYYEIGEYSPLEYDANRFAFINLVMSGCYLFQCILAVIIISQINNEAISTGAALFDYVIHGKKKMFFRELLAFFIISTIFFLIQVGIVLLLGTFLNEDKSFLLSYTAEGIKVTTVSLAIIQVIINFYINLILMWSLIFLISKLLDKTLFFAIVGIISVFIFEYFVPELLYLVMPSAYETIKQVIYYDLGDTATTYYFLGVVIKMIIALSSICIAYKRTNKRNFLFSQK